MRSFDQRKQQRTCGAGGLSEDCHIVRITAKTGNVLVNPPESHHLVHKAQILGVRIFFSVRQMGQMEKTENTDPVRNGNGHNVRILPHEIAALVQRVSRPAVFEGSAVNPHHDRLFACGFPLCLPDIQVQAVFPLKVEGSLLSVCLVLAGTFRVIIRLVHPIVRPAVHRRLPAVLSDRLLSDKRNALV